MNIAYCIYIYICFRPFQKWIDGSSVTYTAWMPGEPNNYGGREDCTEIYSEQARWNDLKCGHGRAFICMKRPKSHNRKGGCNKCGCGYGCKKLTKGQKRRDKRRRRRWARIRQYMRWEKRRRRRRRKALRKVRRRNRKRRAKWRAKLRKVRRKRREELQREYQHEMHLEKRRNSAFHLLNKLIGSALRGSPGGTQAFGQVGEFLTRRRR